MQKLRKRSSKKAPKILNTNMDIYKSQIKYHDELSENNIIDIREIENLRNKKKITKEYFRHDPLYKKFIKISKDKQNMISKFIRNLDPMPQRG